MSYPAYKISMPDSEGPTPIEDLQIDTWPDGSARGRAFATAEKYSWVLVHPALTEAERVALDAYYWANRALPFDFLDRSVSPAVTRNNCIFLGAPVWKRNESRGDNRTWRATVRIRTR